MKLTTTIYRSAGLIHNDLQREAYTFIVGAETGTLRLTNYSLQTRLTTRHKWRPTGQRYSEFESCTFERADVVVPESVIAEALAEIRDEYQRAAALVEWDPS